MWLKNGGFLAAVLALLAISLVCLATWFTITYGEQCEVFLEKCDASALGGITLAAVLVAGGLLAFAFDRIDESYVLFKERSSDDAEAGD